MFLTNLVAELRRHIAWGWPALIFSPQTEH